MPTSDLAPQTIRILCPYLFAFVNRPLHNTFDPLESRAHLRACPDWRDGIVQSRLLVRICEKTILDRSRTFTFTISLQLEGIGTLGVCGRCAVSKHGAREHVLSRIS